MAYPESKVVEFPGAKDRRLEEAIRLYDLGQFAAALISLTRLIDEQCDEAYYYVGCIYEEGGN